MSHFKVAVFEKKKGPSVDDLLAPYQENNESSCPKEYLEFIDVEDEYLEGYNEDNEGYNTFEEYMEDRYGGPRDEETERYGYWENPNAKWDWYRVLESKPVKKYNFSFNLLEGSWFPTYAVITPDGVWHAPGEVGWFATTSASKEEEEDWFDNYNDRFIKTADPNWILSIVDCHI